jgi:hypothetical protein
MGTREERTTQFRQVTEKNILKCADWMRRNAEDLAYRFAGGCENWSIEFRSDATDGINVVVVNVKNSRSDLVAFGVLADDTGDSEPL